MKKTIISLSGVATSGKDTVADCLVERYEFNKIAFANPLKKGCMEIFGLTEEQVFGSQKEVEDPFWGVTPRFLLQKVGTDLLRNQLRQDIWVKATERKIKMSQGSFWCVSDCRFKNEIEAVKSWGGYVVKINRPHAKASGGIAGHISEKDLDDYTDWDYVIENDGTLDELYSKVYTMLEALLSRGGK